MDPQQPKGSQERIDEIKKHLTYKMPITFRYGFILGVLAGFTHMVVRQKPSLFLIHGFVWTNGLGIGLCYKEFSDILKIKFLEK